MKDHWPIDATDEERSLRVFKDALMNYSVEKPWSFLSSEQERAAELAASEVENAYARVREHADPALARSEDGGGSGARGLGAGAGGRRWLRLADGAARPPLRLRMGGGALRRRRGGCEGQPRSVWRDERRGRHGRRDEGPTRARSLPRHLGRGGFPVRPQAARGAARHGRAIGAACRPGRQGGGGPLREGLSRA